MKKILLKIKKYLSILLVSFRSQTSYRTDMIAQNIFFALIIFIFINLWNKIYSTRAVFAGYKKEEIIWYFIITEIITLTTQRFFFQISRQIKDGSIAYVLNKPYNYLLYIMSENAGSMIYKFISNSVIGIIMGTLFVSPLNLHILINLPHLLICIIFGVMIHFFLQTFIALSAMFVEDNSAFFWIYFKCIMIFGILIPIDVFPEKFFNILKYSPFAYITYAPAKLFLNFSFDMFYETLFFQVIYFIFALIISILLFKKGARHVSIQGG
ncbi:MAG: ABC-2 family transporter protein [Spirochaetes bacterium]|nr:ABC-2 family transporter protein [Spirochaetota bacterium]